MASGILVIDDDDEFRGVLVDLLEGEGYLVMAAGDGDEGLRILSDGFDAEAVVTDILMPGKEGIETIREVRRSPPETKILAISGGERMDGESYLAMARRFGAHATLSKPFKRQELVAELDALLAVDIPPIRKIS